MKCIIVDDEACARVIVSELVKAIPKIEVVAELTDALEALKYLTHNDVDLVFLDIHMPRLTGVDLIETIKNPPKIVLTTSDTDFAIEAYAYEFIVDYLVKPITKERFEKCAIKLENALEKQVQEKEQMENRALKSEGEDLFINIDRRLIKLKFRDILIIEAKGDYIEIETKGKRFRVHTTLKKVKEKLPESRFLQIHRSYIINFTQIIDIQDNSVLIERHVVPISRSNRPELMRRLNLL